MINKKPYVEISSQQVDCWEGWEAIGQEIKKHASQLDKKLVVVAIEFYQGTYASVNLGALKEVLTPNVTCQAKDIYKDEHEIRQLVNKDISFEGISAKFSTNTIEDYFDEAKLEALRGNIGFIEEGVVLIQGVGASKIWEPDILVYSDVSKWEILQRFRRGDISNIGVKNNDMRFEQLMKWSYFVDWRICDKIKRKTLPTCHYFLETNNWKAPKLIGGDLMRTAYNKLSKRPFFTAPFFDPELWDHKNEGTDTEEFPWVFDCDFEKNNILFKLGEHLVEVPAINAIYCNAQNILGTQIYRKYGMELPIRLAFMDSLDNERSNIMAYPDVDFIRDNFGIYQNQSDNYYIMRANASARINVGIKENTSQDFFESQVINAVTKKAKKELVGLLEEYPVSAHDHFVIPEGTLHTEGHKLIALNITTASSIFKLSLFDDDHTIRPAQLVDQLLEQASNSSKTHKLSPGTSKEIETGGEQLDVEQNNEVSIQRFWIKESTTIQTDDNLQILNLVAGKKAFITGDFEPFEVHYSESFIVPAAIGQFNIEPIDDDEIGILKITTSK